MDEKVTFDSLGIREEVLKGIKDEGFEVATPIQAKIIPAALEGRDVLGSAETGSGKTAAFMIPVLHSLMDGEHGFRCLVLEPTRELAIQVKDVTEALSKHTGLKNVVLFGGVKSGHQVAQVKDGVDIIVATPGRLIDLVWQGLVDFNKVTHLVVDEVDRMFDMGFIDDILQIISYLPPRGSYQRMFFSATMPDHVTKMISEHLNNPEQVVIGRRSKPAEGITHKLYIVSNEKKFDALMHVIKNTELESAIIFSETKHGADQLCKQLQKAKVDVSPFHSGYDQVQRYDILRKFRRGGVKMLVATNVAARGLDITGISHVFNYEVPQASEDYVHRIGRSARADATGVAITFACKQEERYIRNIEKLIDMKLPVEQIDGITLDDFPPRRSGKPVQDRKYRGRKPGGYHKSSGKDGGGSYRGKGGKSGGGNKGGSGSGSR